MKLGVCSGSSNPSNALNMQYYVNEKEGVVVCVINAQKDDAIFEIYRIMHKEHDFGLYVQQDDYLIKTRFVGKAVCHPNDTFDVEKGKQLAKLRALKKYNAAKLKVFDKFTSTLELIRCRVEDTLEFYSSRIIECEAEELELTE